MFTKNISPTYFETRFGIHTFFVKTKVDVVILDSDSRVRYIKENLAPWRIFVWNPKYFRILELPNGMVKEKKIQIGERIRIYSLAIN